VVTLAVGLVCFVTAYAFVTFWSSAERHFANAPDIYALTLTIRNRDNGSGLENYPRIPDVALESLKSDYPAITTVARATLIDGKTMIASGGRAERVFGAAADPEFLELFDLPFVAGDARRALASPRSVVITRDLAARLFGADDAIGKSIVIGN